MAKGPGAPNTSTPTGRAHTSESDPESHVTMRQTDADGSKGGATHEHGEGVEEFGKDAENFNKSKK
jgi:hypothetical protein